MHPSSPPPLGAELMGILEESPVPAESPEETPPLHKREVLWALSIILALTVAPALGDLYDAYCL